MEREIRELTSKESCVMRNSENGDEPADHVESGQSPVAERENGNKLTHDLHPVANGDLYWDSESGHRGFEMCF